MNESTIIKKKASQVIPADYMTGTIAGELLTKNNFYQFLLNYLPPDVIAQTFRMYNVGTHNYWRGSTLYWLVNQENKITHSKIVLHGKHNGKVVAPGNTVEHFNDQTRRYELVSAEKYCAKLYNGFDEFTNRLKLRACFFGSHLISQKDKRPVILVQNESSAVIGSIYVPDAVWLAVGDARFEQLRNLKVLANKKVIILPNYGGFSTILSKYTEWCRIAKQVLQSSPQLNLQIQVSDALEVALAKRERLNQTPGEMLLAGNRLFVEQLEKLGLKVKSFK